MPSEITAIARLELPYRAIGLIETTWPDGSRSIGTCTLVGRNDVITAGHCVYDPDSGGYGLSYKFYFGADYNAVSNTFEDSGYQVNNASVEILTWPSLTHTNTSNDTLTMSEAQYDIALIGLQTPAGDRQGYLSMASGFDTGFTSNNLAAQVVGYASGSTGLMAENLIVSHSDYIHLYASYVASLGPGSSGGPLLYQMAGASQVLIGVKSTSSWWADIGGLYSEIQAAMISNDNLIVDRLSPSILTVTPESTATLVLPATDVVIHFTEAVQAGSGNLLLKSQGEIQQTVAMSDATQVTLSRDTLRIDFLQELSPGTSYELVVPSAYVRDMAGNALASTSITFTTRSLGERLEFQIANEDLPTSYNSSSGISQQVGVTAYLKQGTEGHDQLTGSDAIDYLLTYGGDDVIQAGAGRDRIYAGSGDDTGSGEDGIDTLVYGCNFSEVLVEPNSLDGELLGITVTDRFASGIGHDSFTNVERLEFVDYGVAFDVDEANQAGGIYRLYQAAFDRVPDLPGLGYWIEQADEGKSAVRMGEDFTWSQEFQSVYQVSITDNYATGAHVQNLVKGFYQNVLGRDPDAGGLTYYTGVIGSHEKTVGRVLAEIADSPENRDLVADDIINGILYRPYAQNVQTLNLDEISEGIPQAWSIETSIDTWPTEPTINTDWLWFV